LKRGALEEARKYAQATARISDHVLGSTKRLLELMGIPWIQAPSEGEAQAAFLAGQGLAYAAASQDYDSALFGAPRIVRNLGITGRRKLPGRSTYIEVKPEMVDVWRSMSDLGVTREELIEVAIIVGTDYCEGVKGLGAKKALSLIKRGVKLGDAYREKNLEPPENLQEIVEFFTNPPVAEVRSLDFRAPDREGIVSLLVDEYSFSEQRVARTLDEVIKKLEMKRSGLGRFM